MEDLAQLVADSLARHGYDAPLDHRRLEWSRWFRCDSSLTLLLVPTCPGIYALGEELGSAGDSNPVILSDVRHQSNESRELIPLCAASNSERSSCHSPGNSSAVISSKRTLAVFEIADTDDLGAALWRLFAPGHPLRDRLASGRCFARYSRVSDPDQRQAAVSALRRWLMSSTEIVTGLGLSFEAPPESHPGAPEGPSKDRSQLPRI